MDKRATIKDVAIEAGVSIGTVDRIIHQRGRYSKETEEIVKQAIKKLNYKPSQIASALVTMKSHIKIGVSYPLDETPELFWEEAGIGTKKAQKELTPFGIEIISDCPASFSSESQWRSIKKLVNKNVHAIITAAFNKNSIDERFKNYIPENIPYATVINRAWESDALFHIGPNDEAMGALIAKTISLYCKGSANVVIISPNMEVEGTQKRLSGFVNKVLEELPGIKILQVCPVLAKTTADAYQNIYLETKRIIELYPDLDAIYITNGFIKTSADAIRDCSSRVKIFGHEYFSGIDSYLNDGSVCATIYQNPTMQWYEAIMTMTNYLRSKTLPKRSMNIDCTLITKETLPLHNLRL